MADIRTVESAYNACIKINQVRATHPYKPEQLKKQFPEVAKEILIVLPVVLEYIDEIIKDKSKIIAEIAKIPSGKKRKELMEKLKFLTDSRTVDTYVNLYNNLIPPP